MYRILKRVFDIVFSLLLSITLLPVFLILIVLIKIDSRGPILFKQKRVGKNKKYFNILKFRTMYIYTPKDKPTHLLENPEQYITRVGKFLRKTSLDELPQIWNILIGQMSVIGPRPALWNQYDLINERENFKVNEIRPGLTGWAQINGRDELPIKVKAEFDHYYIKNMSFALDCKCFFGTILSVIKHEGVVEGGTGSLQILQQEIAASKEISIGEELSK